MAKNFSISEHKVILWSKRNILHGRLVDIRENYSGYNALMLKESDFEISISTDMKEKKGSKLLKKKTVRQNVNEELQEINKSSSDYIESIYSRNKTMSYVEEDGETVEYEEVVLKLRHNENQVYLLQYVLDKNEEKTWLTGSKDT